MKRKIILLSVLSLFCLSSCTTKTKIIDKNYDEYLLSYVQYSELPEYEFKGLYKFGSDDLKDKAYKLYKNIIESDEPYIDIKISNFNSIDYFDFTFIGNNLFDSIGISNKDDSVYVTYDIEVENTIERYYKSFNSSLLKEEVKELKNNFKEELKDVSWFYENSSCCE